MTHPTDIRFTDPVTDLVFRALAQARTARRMLEEDLPLLIPHTSRPFVAAFARRCAADEVFGNTFERDLDALIGQLDAQIAAETRVEVHCDPDTGASWEDPHLSPGGETLDRTARALRKLRATLDAVADACAAEVIRGGL